MSSGRQRSSGQGESNFIRRNLRNRRGVGRKRRSSRPSADSRHSDSRQGEEAQDREQSIGRGLGALGLDPLSLSLDFAGRTAKRPKLSTRTCPSLPSPDRVRAPRGLVLKESRAKGKSNEQRLSLSESDLIRLAPTCPLHRLPARLLVVKKAGANRGRRFYACSFSSDESCGFFMWAEDCPAVVQEEVGSLNTRSGAVSWEDKALERYRQKISGFSTNELKVSYPLSAYSRE